MSLQLRGVGGERSLINRTPRKREVLEMRQSMTKRITLGIHVKKWGREIETVPTRGEHCSWYSFVSCEAIQYCSNPELPESHVHLFKSTVPSSLKRPRQICSAQLIIRHSFSLLISRQSTLAHLLIATLTPSSSVLFASSAAAPFSVSHIGMTIVFTKTRASKTLMVLHPMSMNPSPKGPWSFNLARRRPVPK